MKSDVTHVWSSVEIHNLYKAKDGSVLSRRCLIQKLKEHFNNDLIILSSPGLSSVVLVLFRCTASHLFRIEETDDEEVAVSNVAKQMISILLFQVAPGALVGEKNLIETLSDFGVTCTYDET